jgi:hypothetical protein
MYPQAELTRLHYVRAGLRWRIARQRGELAQAGERVLRPVAQADRIIGWWQRLSPMIKVAAVPLMMAVRRSLFRRRPAARAVGALGQWIPLLMNGFRLWRGMRGESARPAR